MLVQLRLLGSFARFGSNLREGKLLLSEGARIQDVVDELGLPAQNIMLVLVNGQPASLNAELSEGDSIQVFPPVGGG